MKSIEIRRYGGPEVFRLVERESPRAGSLQPHEVRVRVNACGINFADLLMRMGTYPEAPPLPFSPGYEVAGEVIETGSAVTSFRPGDRVFGGTRFGGYTNEITLPDTQVFKTPEHLTDIEAASIPVNFITAWIAVMDMARVRPGDRVLVQSAAGGVGIAAVQLAAQAGAHVVGLVGSKEKMETVLRLGAKEVLLNSEWESASDDRYPKFDAILDAQGGKSLKRSFRRLASEGRVISYGVSDMIRGPKRNWISIISMLTSLPFFHTLQLMKENKGVFGLNVLQLFEPANLHQLTRAMDGILKKFGEKELHTVVGRVFPLAEAGKAHHSLQSRKTIGKIILDCR